MLDRAICNEFWFEFWRSTSSCLLVRHQSDHHAMLVSSMFSTVPHATSFKFFKTWLMREDCKCLVSASWVWFVLKAVYLVISKSLRG